MGNTRTRFPASRGSFASGPPAATEVWGGLLAILALGAMALGFHPATSAGREIPFGAPSAPAKVLGIANGGGDAVAAGDLDGDSDLDVVSISPYSVSWWENAGASGDEWAQHSVSRVISSKDSVAVADLDGDGDTDVVVSSEQDGLVNWLENADAKGTSWGLHVLPGDFSNVSRVLAADLDGDEDADLAMSFRRDSDNVMWLENTQGNATGWVERVIDDGYRGEILDLAAGDLDGDGDLDLVGPGRGGSRPSAIDWWENSRGTGRIWSAQTVDGNFSNGRAVFVADVDGDDDADILCTSENNGMLGWWRNTRGDGSRWSKGTIDPVFAGISLCAGDWDRDGDVDILAASENAGVVSWWANEDGLGGAWTEYVLESDFPDACWVAAADLDEAAGDEALAVDRNLGEIRWWDAAALGSAAKTAEHALTGDLGGAMSVCTGDMDGDGDLDMLVAAAEPTNRIVLWDNADGAGTAWNSRYVSGGFRLADVVVAADISGDGVLDAAGAAWWGGVRWFRNATRDGKTWESYTVFPENQSLDATHGLAHFRQFPAKVC